MAVRQRVGAQVAGGGRIAWGCLLLSGRQL